MDAYECIQGFSQNLFWDVRLESIDLEANAPYVVQRYFYISAATSSC